MREETHRDQAHRLKRTLEEAAAVLASVSPCPFAPDRALDGQGHFDNRSPQCRARTVRHRRPRPFVAEMVQFVEQRRAADPDASWAALQHDWNAGHGLHPYRNADSMREAYGNALRRHHGSDRVPDICRSCVLQHLQSTDSRSQGHRRG